MADVAADLKTWSTTAASNSPADATTVGSGLADNLQEIQKVVRQDLAHKGADIASAGTTDLGAVVGLMHDITGTTTITSFGTVSAGIWKFIKFEGALTLTHNGTSLILPGAANITTANGDTAIVMSEGSGNWRVINYEPTAGLAGSRVLLSSQVASASAQLDFTSVINAALFQRYVLEFLDVRPATDGADFWLRMSTDNGSSFIASGYSWCDIQNDTSTTTPSGAGSSSDTKIRLADNLDSNAGNPLLSGEVHISHVAGLNPIVRWDLAWDSNSTLPTQSRGMGQPSGASATNALRVMMSTGNITSGTVRLFAVR